jgi:hypothetical protein
MIKWLRASHCAVPQSYPCLMMLESGDSVIGTYRAEMKVIAWTVVNLPEWMMLKTGAGAGTGKACGENHPKTTLSDDDCTTIRVAYDTGSFSYQMLADKFDCSKSTIRDIIKERTRFSDRMRR